MMVLALVVKFKCLVLNSESIPMAKILVCVAWPYSNSALHLGHVAGSLLPPDIFAKYHILKGDEVLMVSGSDQHGTPVTVTAEKEGTTAEAVAERYHSINKKAIEDLVRTADTALYRAKNSGRNRMEIAE
jgi:methionyl-tRNA synthetase